MVAITALTTIFEQIVSRPENVAFRRIRRNHEQFHQDIGRHDGGKELLLAAGFRLGEIDEVPCFISSEPNVETDLDAWTDWFDLLTATLEILQGNSSDKRKR
uniref:PUB domain-containing protein n=1 Tax=Grammatophora oceanica TaxID=210454 RepID=A0A7S1Y1F1_9STRA|mmetsp:Transcript_1479/g.2030  ORF Transcript_1479/g.2030 Transcript_1479/m.2030 type:complete len:102 (+) Transcript_1479:1-306(+)